MPSTKAGAQSDSILEWRGVSFKVPDPDAKRSDGSLALKTILHEQNGSARSGRMLAIMGASGAGKTSLLNILSCRTQAKARKFCKSTLLLNNRPMSGSKMQSSVAFVQQEDALMATDTPHEAIDFSANLRLAQKFKKDRKAKVTARVEAVEKQLGLEDCKDTRIGDIKLKGISGGEKRRVAIGVEIVSDPDIVFLDEPTSGLDFVTAHSVVGMMKKLAESGKIVIATIHQPNSEIFHMFDDLLLLVKGQVAYHGPLHEAEGTFKSCGFECPLHYNPADYYLRVLHDQDNADKILSMKSEEPSIQPKVVPPHELLKIPPAKVPSIFTQLKYLFLREARSYWRNPAAALAQFGLAVFMGLFLGSINKGAGGKDQDLMDVRGSLFLPMINSFFQGFSGYVLVGIQRRTLFDREHMAGTYGIFAYMLTTVLVALPVNIASCGTLLFLLQLFIQWQGSMLLTFVAMLTCQMIGVAWGLAVGFTTGDVNVANAFGPALIVPQIYLAGFYRATQNMPAGIRWLQWWSALNYAFKTMTIIEFGDLDNHVNPYVIKESSGDGGNAARLQELLTGAGISSQKMADIKAQLSTETASAHTLRTVKRQLFTDNGINAEDPHSDLLFYTMVPLAYFFLLLGVSMIALKISAMRR